MHRKRAAQSRWVRVFGVFAALAICTSLVSADQALRPLSALIDASDSIIIGVVETVAAGRAPEEQITTIGVEEVLLGPQLPRLALRGGTTEHTLPVGLRILAFLRQISTMQQDTTFEPVAGEHGVMAVTSGAAVGVTREVVTRALERGQGLRLQDVREQAAQEALRSQTALPRVLRSALLEELKLRVTGEEAAFVAEIVCNSQGTYAPEPQEWAILRAGHLQLEEARPCLEALLQDGTNLGLVLAAAEALGDLGNPASVPVLLSLLPDVPTEPTSRSLGPDQEDERIAGHDPEDTADPRPDPREAILTPGVIDDDGELAGGPSAPLPTTADGEIEPDDARSDDRIRRRADAGLSNAAVLALGKIGDAAAVADLVRVAREGDDLALHSSVVRALGLIGGLAVREPLTSIMQTHPNPLVRQLAQQTLARL